MIGILLGKFFAHGIRPGSIPEPLYDVCFSEFRFDIGRYRIKRIQTYASTLSLDGIIFQRLSRS